MGAPLFEIRQLAEENGIYVFRFNYELYGDMSHRVVRMLSKYAPQVEVDLGNFRHVDIGQHAKAIWERVPRAKAFTVFLETSRFLNPGQGYFNSRTVKLESPTDSELVLVPAPMEVHRAIFLPGFRHKKTGIIVTGLCPANQVQENLFSCGTQERDSGLMQTLDTLRQRFGHSVLRYGVQGTGQK
ncbi:hypothetical protein [Sabulibacter ruber]|uniref:DinB/UmuC family translesion DNA polymerase n=1 Tax=Sabulibacter ruber TaxID=2811901 RepID=UPI001A974BFC|nr:hypothetical protein [Sabulibacter ruber]